MTSRKIAIISATPFECLPLLNEYQRGRDQFMFAHTGVGLVNMAIQCQKLISEKKPDACLLIGIAGSFTNDFNLNQVVAVQDEYYGDLGVQEEEDWRDIFELNLADPNQYPFQQKKLINTWLPSLAIELNKVSAVSVNTISTHRLTIERYKFNDGALIENMEGAAFHQVMLENKIPFLQIRAISNMVGDRDKKQWSLAPAIQAVNQTAVDLLNNGLFNDLT